MNPHRLKAYLLLLMVAVIWGIAGPVIKITLGKIPPDLFILYRFLISTLITLPFFLVKGIKIPKEKISRLELASYCLLNSSVTLGLLFWGTAKTSLLSMSLIELLGPLLLMAAGFLFLKDQITKREKIGALIAFAGAGITGLSPLLGTGHRDGELFGNFLIFLSLISGAVCGVLAKKLMRKDISPALLANLSFLVGFITTFPFVIFNHGFSYALTPLTSASVGTWLVIFYMALISGNLAYILNNMGQKTIELSEAAPFAYLYPLFSALLAIVFLGDKLTFTLAAGSVMTLAGVLIAETKTRLEIVKKKRYN